MTTTPTNILGTDTLDRPITNEQMWSCNTLKDRIKLLSEITGPLQPHLAECLRLTEIQSSNLEHLRTKSESLKDALASLLKGSIATQVEEEVTRQTEYYVHQDSFSEYLENAIDTRSFRRALASTIEDAFENHDFNDQIDNAVNEYDFDDKISDAISNYDFGDTINDAVSDAMKTYNDDITEPLCAAIKNDPHHPLITAIINALVTRVQATRP